MYRPQKCEFCAREIPLTNLKVSNILFCLFIIYNITSNQFWLFQSTKVSNWQTGRATVWVNRAQNSGLVNFVPKLPLPFVQISSIYRKKKKKETTDREGLKLVSNMALKKRNTNFRLECCFRKNRTTFSDVPLFPEIFRWNDPKSSVPFSFQPGFPEIVCTW